MSKRSKACQRCRRCETLYCKTNKGSKGYVFQRCQKWYLWLLHNTVYRVMLLMLLMSEVSKVYCTLYTVASHPCQEGRLFSALSTKRMIAGKMHSQSPVLKTKGAHSNLEILRYLQTKLHPPYPNQTACL